MATKLRCARLLIYSAAELKENHEPYGMEAAMAKQYASDIALEVTNDALQIFGGSGYLKGMEVERHTGMPKSLPFMKEPMKSREWSSLPISSERCRRMQAVLPKSRKKRLL